ncbi:MAG: DNA-binding protein [Candidatus Methanoplasma sp.]|jgi:predicted DNA-binding protein with PD1-like motif|nr:DNA-binding protein [Candidatus Methanoplasma sp.]
MKSAEASLGRVFVLRLEAGEVLHEAIEGFARANGVRSALLTATGGIGPGSRITVGPKDLPGDEIVAETATLDKPHELTATGTLFPDEDGNPMIHMHGSAGRDGTVVTGCLRAGVIAWLVLEVTIAEISGDGMVRRTDPRSGMKILSIE